MKKISDIRIYKGNHFSTIENKVMNLCAHRVAMKLREKEFSVGEYDHLYLCFSTDEPAGSIVLDDKVDKYFPWFRRVYIGINLEVLQSIETAQEPSVLLEQIENVLIRLCGDDCNAGRIIKESIEEAKNGPRMLMKFKEKKTAKVTAIIYLRLLDNGYYQPLLSVIKPDGTEVLREDLPEIRDLASMGEIQLSSKKITIKPRKNVFAKELQPISFAISL